MRCNHSVWKGPAASDHSSDSNWRQSSGRTSRVGETASGVGSYASRDDAASLGGATCPPPPSRSNRKRGQQQVAALEVPPTKVNIRLIPFADRLFCWTHGPCQHVGTGCEGPPINERNKKATWRNQMGSQWRELFKSKGWSTVSP